MTGNYARNPSNVAENECAIRIQIGCHQWNRPPVSGGHVRFGRPIALCIGTRDPILTARGVLDENGGRLIPAGDDRRTRTGIEPGGHRAGCVEMKPARRQGEGEPLVIPPGPCGCPRNVQDTAWKGAGGLNGARRIGCKAGVPVLDM